MVELVSFMVFCHVYFTTTKYNRKKSTKNRYRRHKDENGIGTTQDSQVNHPGEVDNFFDEEEQEKKQKI